MKLAMKMAMAGRMAKVERRTPNVESRARNVEYECRIKVFAVHI